MNIIRQTARFKAPASRLFSIYINPALHAAMTGAPVKIARRPGSKFEAFGGVIRGKTLYVVPNKLIVQEWRSAHFGRSDPNSLLIMTFADCSGGSRIDIVHLGVPDVDLRGVQSGWPKHYWRPLRKYLSKPAARRAPQK